MIKYIEKQKGYAILFTVVIISIISVIALGLANSSYKQLILSSVARDSQVAFYESDIATECALYADNQTDIPSDDNSLLFPTFTCGGHTFNVSDVDVVGGRQYGYVFKEQTPNLALPCFTITVDKTVATPIVTNINAKGYNVCNLSSLRTVERAIKITY